MFDFCKQFLVHLHRSQFSWIFAKVNISDDNIIFSQILNLPSLWFTQYCIRVDNARSFLKSTVYLFNDPNPPSSPPQLAEPSKTTPKQIEGFVGLNLSREG